MSDPDDDDGRLWAFVVKKTLANPCWGAKHVLGVTLDAWQVELVEAVWDVWRKKRGLPTKYNHEGHNKIAVRAMHGPGKTFGLAVVFHLWNLTRKALSLATAPKQEQIKSRLFPALRKVRNSAIHEYRDQCDITALKATWCGDPDWCVIGETANDPGNLAGYHDDYILVAVDEAGGVREEFFPVLEGAVSTGVCPILILIGNPIATRGTFFKAFNSPPVAKYFYKIHVSLANTTRVKREWVAQMEAKYGKDSPIVKIRCYGEFAEGSGNQLFAMDWFVAATAVEQGTDGGTPIKRISIDVADGGMDETVLTYGVEYAEKVDLVRQTSHNFPSALSPILAAKQGITMWESYGLDVRNGDCFVVDANGVGAGTAGYLISEGYPVICYRGGESSDDPSRWRNRRVQTSYACKNAFQTGKVSIASDFVPEEELDDVFGQFLSINLKQGSDRVEDIETKVDLIRRGVKSPDRAESIVMQFVAKTPQLLGNSSGGGVISGGDTHTAGYDGGLA